MNEVQIRGLFLNLIIYIIMISPIILISLKKENFSTKKNFLNTLIYCTFLEIALSFILFLFPEKIFSLFTNTKGIINFAVYASKILFISSSLFAFKIIVPVYLKNKNKKITILVLSKIVITIILCTFLYFTLNTKGLLFAIPICDFMFFIIYFLNIIR